MQENPRQTPQDPATARADFLAALRNTFRSPDGDRVLEWLHATAATRRPAFLPGAAGTALDPIAAAVRDGRKAIVWEIEAALADAESPAPGQPPPRSRARLRP